ncbi:unnamed protein product [Psylliodes chrysocephalus]|uniref:HAT C-terminal dimerisation domain-containing protein n=1 Tax=Psylliodes chrysocephalus TaxID=3402493 RepID=A0A9P0G8V4_9CUCU|nr:unnamed protein product [Psylliodes chrysocephala]
MKYYLNETENRCASKEESTIIYVNDDDALPNITETSPETGFQHEPEIVKSNLTVVPEKTKRKLFRDNNKDAVDSANKIVNANQQPGSSKQRTSEIRGIESFFQPLSKRAGLACAATPVFGLDNSNKVVDPIAHASSRTPESTVFDSSDNLNNHIVVATSSRVLESTVCNRSNVPYDIGNFLNKHLDDYTKYQLLSNHWQPKDDYKFPYSSHLIKGKEVKRYFGHKYLSKYPWLVFSPAKQGLFCKYCPFFATGGVGRGQKAVPLQKLVTKPLINFKDIAGQNGDLETHANYIYHKRAAEQGVAFLHTYNNPNLEVINRVHQQRLKKVEENRERLRPIVETIIFLGRQNLAFRGHRDDLPILHNTEISNECDMIVNEGNFRELLRFRVSAGDKKLEKHLQSASSNATYISKTTQNMLISCCGQEISEQILSKVRASRYYSILFDETTDVSHLSQLSLTLRYVHDGNIHEDFVSFVDPFEELAYAKHEHDYESDEENWKETKKLLTAEEKLDGPSTPKELSLTGKAIGQIVLYQLKKKLKLPLEQCLGIGTDGCAVMLSEVRGAVTEVQKEAKNAVRAPCYSHKLNNSISRSSKVPAIRDAVASMKEVIAFFKSHPKRKHVLMSTLGCALTSLCETRWVERHEGVLQFSVDLAKIVETLGKISEWRDPSTAGKAASLVTTLCNTQFMVSVLCLSDVLSLTQSLSKLLQKTALDLNGSAVQVKNTISILASRRENIDASFNNIWQRAENLANELGIELNIPRIPRLGGRQIYRANHQMNSAEEYYRVSIYAPLLDSVLTDLRERFSAETLGVFQLSVFIPENIIKSSPGENDKSIKFLLDRFGLLLGVDKGAASLLLKDELLLWREKWVQEKEQQKELPITALEILARCDKDAFPIIHEFVLVLATLPVTNASAERSFSSLRRLKTYLRATKTENRLLGLALMHIHRHIPIDMEKVITRYAKTGHKKRLEFII